MVVDVVCGCSLCIQVEGCCSSNIPQPGHIIYSNIPHLQLVITKVMCHMLWISIQIVCLAWGMLLKQHPSTRTHNLQPHTTYTTSHNQSYVSHAVNIYIDCVSGFRDVARATSLNPDA